MSKVEEFLNHASYETPSSSEELANTPIDELWNNICNGSDCILYGPPGTGKSYMISKLLKDHTDEIGKSQMVQFHSNYSYEDFIEGISPDADTGGFKITEGTFFSFCKSVENEKIDKKCIFVIDEINRANITSVFGEVMYLMENKGERKLRTPKSNSIFTIPQNVIIVGTMNTADKTLSKIDFALRRRFRMLPVNPSPSTLNMMLAANGFDPAVRISIDDFVNCFKIINARILKNPLLGKNLTLGHVLWTKRGTQQYTEHDIALLFTQCIFAQIETYCGTNIEALGQILGASIRDKIVAGRAISDNDIMDFLCEIRQSHIAVGGR